MQQSGLLHLDCMYPTPAHVQRAVLYDAICAYVFGPTHSPHLLLLLSTNWLLGQVLLPYSFFFCPPNRFSVLRLIHSTLLSSPLARSLIHVNMHSPDMHTAVRHIAAGRASEH